MDPSGCVHYDFPEIELPVEPVQRPYPPLWAAGNVAPAARHGLNVVSGAPLTAELRARYDEGWAESDMPHAEAQRTMDAFIAEVIPAIRALEG